MFDHFHHSTTTLLVAASLIKEGDNEVTEKVQNIEPSAANFSKKQPSSPRSHGLEQCTETTAATTTEKATTFAGARRRFR